METMPARHLHVTVARPADRVYAFAADPANLPQWASGLARGITRSGRDWWADSPMGRVRVRMAPRNPHGVLDHEVTLPDGRSVLNPMRVVPNGGGSELSFTLFRLPGTTDATFASDAALVQADLERLRALLEAPTPAD